jgi:hypothetical protein
LSWAIVYGCKVGIINIRVASILFLFLFTASVLKFDDGKKQKTYETVSFKELHEEIHDLQVLFLFIFILAVIYM